MLSSIKKDKKVALVSLIFLAFFGWFLYIHLTNQTNDNHYLDWFAGTYGVTAIIGGVYGLFVAKHWGGYKSVIGKAVIFFSLGLLMQEFGQLVYAYYAIVKEVTIPYPSVGDLGYFGSVILYILASWQLARASGIKFSLKDKKKKLVATILPLALLFGCYMYFLRGYEFDSSHPLTIILDFGYPLGQALYIVIALMTYLFSKKLLGGVMKNKVLLILVALVAQYAADFNFLFQANRETWTTAGYGDFLYMLSYTVMALALINMSTSLLGGQTSTEQEPVVGNEA